jgi:hypothetical protein
MNTSFALFGEKSDREKTYSDLEETQDIKNFAERPAKEEPNEKIKAKYAFRKRFGIDRLIYKNKNMIDVLNNPSSELEKINKDYQVLAWEMADLWRRVFLNLQEAGYSDEEAKRRADEYIAPLIMAETKLIKARHPFALGGSKKEKQSLMEQLYQRLKGTRSIGHPPSTAALAPSNVKGKAIEEAKGESISG